jgi:hypothetical protein
MSSYRVIIEETTSQGRISATDVYPDANMDAKDGWRCLNCDEVTEDAPQGPLYECNACGTQFTRDGSADGSSHKCPDCNKFATKLAAYGCDICGEGEMEAIFFVECPRCGESFDEGDFLSHLETCLTR